MSETVIHGAMVRVFNLGVLLLGRSGIGKTGCVIDLLSLGHCLIADDAVKITTGQDGGLHASPCNDLRPYLHLRGVGVVDVRQIFGTHLLCDGHRVDLVIRLCDEGAECEDELLGDRLSYTLQGQDCPCLNIPASPQKNLAGIIEVAVKNEQVKRSGMHALKDFINAHEKLLNHQ
ncbi:MAG: hypothetical protein HQM16_03880 [Deltaproteobacteria bacterium]|nr:hypothetical protein [Deltaproteobacteria bacterium]